MENRVKVRVRLAPSPTGEVHIGTIWIAHFAWLYARQHHGTFVLRIEDTDRQRLVPGSVDRIYEALDWYGLTPDEGPRQGGSYGPYVQSERLALYQQYAQQLVEQGGAYYCFCSATRLDELRQQQIAAKQAPRYDKRCATLDQAASASRVQAGERHVIRLNVPTHGTITHHDLIRGPVTFALDQIDDAVLLKSDGFPTYHLAVVVDDHLMEIDPVIRAEEWLPSIPKHLLLYQAFGWAVPQFAHLPLILGADRSKLSKRHGASSALSFRDQGYLPEAMINFLTLMGWHPTGDQEILSPSEILQQFRLEDINPASAIFDRTKLDWLNGWYIRQLPLPALRQRLIPFWHYPTEPRVAAAWLEQALKLIQDRLKTLSEVDQLINYVFPAVWDQERNVFDTRLLIPKKGTGETTNHHLAMTAKWLAEYRGDWTAPALKEAMLPAIAAAGKKNGEILWPLRVALSLRTASPDVFDLLSLLGLAECQRRVASFLSP